MSIHNNLSINLFDLVRQLPDMAYIGLESRLIIGNEFTRKCAGFRSIREMEGKRYEDIRCEAVELHEKFTADDNYVIQTKNSLKQLCFLRYAQSAEVLLLGRKTPLTLENNIAAVFAEYMDITKKSICHIPNLINNDEKFFHHKKQQFLYEITDTYTSPELKLSKRESECLFFILRGRNTKYISRLLNLSVRTVEFYLANIKEKFTVKTIPQLIAKALSQGYLETIPESVIHLMEFA